MMANPRRIVYINNPSSDNPFQIRPSFLASLIQFLQKPHSLPFLLSIFLFLTWISIRLQRASQYPPGYVASDVDWSTEDDMKANLVRFSSGIPSQIAKDKRGWLLDPISLARASGISGIFVFYSVLLFLVIVFHFSSMNVSVAMIPLLLCNLVSFGGWIRLIQ